MPKKNAQYEAMFLFPAGVELENATKIVRTSIERHGGEILVLKKWDERKLTYEIGKHKRGLYVIAYFTAPGTAIGPMERDAKLSEEVVRILVTDASHLNKDEMEAVEPQPIIKVEERPSWDRPMYDDRPPRNAGPRGPRREENAEATGAGKD